MNERQINKSSKEYLKEEEAEEEEEEEEEEDTDEHKKTREEVVTPVNITDQIHKISNPDQLRSTGQNRAG